MKTLCGIWSWEHCLLYSLARDLQGRFTEAWHTLRLSQRPLLLPLASAVCPLAILPSPSQLCVCGGGGVSPPSHSLQAGRTSLPLFSLVVMRKNGFRLARVNSHSTVMEAPLPRVLRYALITHTLSLRGLSREAALSI